LRRQARSQANLLLLYVFPPDKRVGYGLLRISQHGSKESRLQNKNDMPWHVVFVLRYKRRELQHHRTRRIERQPRQARLDLAVVAVADAADEIGLDLGTDE